MIKRTFLADRAAYGFGAVALLLALVIPGVFPAFASAAQLETRSIMMSDSSVGKTGVKYTISFTTSDVFQSMIVDFCSDSPILGTTCNAPTGFDASTVTATSTGAQSIGTITTTNSTASHLDLRGSTATSAAGNVVIEVSGITNPSSAAGSFYARIVTYNAATPAWVSALNTGTHVDDGGIALSTTESVGVTAAVREKLTFCVSLATPGASCSGTSTPNIVLGEGTAPAPIALDATHLSTGQVWTQISTNASGGAIVRMSNSNTECGGLHRAGALATVCDIAPVGSGGATAVTMAAGTPAFGMRMGTATPVGTGSGTLTAQAPYNGAAGDYGMQWQSDKSVGVTSPYGDPIYATTGPADNMNYDLNFAASINNSTPAGLYSANMNLVATGKF